MTFVWIGIGAFVAYVYLLAICLCISASRADKAIRQRRERDEMLRVRR